MNNVWVCLAATVLMHVAGILVIWNGVLAHLFNLPALTLGDAALLEFGHFLVRSCIRSYEQCEHQPAEEGR